ncbi:hypothetical protein WME89_51725 [Sorangium sp. So ce321]|uniref:hypothetical protein n=1 Tax=Sorangium sp. So ce321 TaxID=3133300 RepID=UPI003F600D89
MASNVALGDGAFHTAQIELDEGEVSVSIDGEPPVQGFAISGFPVGSAFFHGFSAGAARRRARAASVGLGAMAAVGVRA